MQSLAKTTIWISIITVALSAVACDIYESQVPISSAEDFSINEDWLGRWVWLTENDFRTYPFFEIDMQAFNQREYAVTFTEYSNNGRQIRAASAYKVFNSEIGSGQYVNIHSLKNRENDKYFFYKIAQEFEDSIYVQFLTDSLETQFEKSSLLRDFIIEEQAKKESNIWSERLVLYRRKLLTWDFLNKIDRSDAFVKFYDLGKLEEASFTHLDRAGVEELIKNSKEIELDNARRFFSDLHLVQNDTWFWKVPSYAIVETNSGKYIKIKYDKRGPFVRDITNDLEYVSISEEERGF